LLGKTNTINFKPSKSCPGSLLSGINSLNSSIPTLPQIPFEGSRWFGEGKCEYRLSASCSAASFWIFGSNAQMRTIGVWKEVYRRYKAEGFRKKTQRRWR